MATSDRDIIITPNRSQSSNPKIEFKGGGTAAGSASTITMVALAKTAHEGTLEIQAPSLNTSDPDTIAAFSEIDNGTLFSVSDDMGVAKFEVNESGVLDAKMSTGALGLPVGITSDRPEEPNEGYTRWNSTNKSMEVYDGTHWVTIVTDYFQSGSLTMNTD